MTVQTSLHKEGEHEATFQEALSEALYEEMQANDKIFLMGEDLRVWLGGGSFGVTSTEKFLNVFGKERVRDTPISEAGFIGAAVGAAATGLRPVVELMYVDFMGVCFDQIFNNAAKMRYMFSDQVSIPLVIRTTIGAGMSFGAIHSQTLYSIFAHCPGLKIVVPSTPYDAKGLLTTALRDQDPVVFFEHKLLYKNKMHIPNGSYSIPFGEAEIKTSGGDVTIVATGAMVQESINAAKRLREENGIHAEVIDTRTLVPLDKKTILDSVRKTGRLVVADEDYERCGIASEISAIVADEGFEFLKAPIKRVVTPTIPIPFNAHLERALIPDEAKIVAAVRYIENSK